MKAFKVIFYLFFLTISYGCGVYSFTGASISPEVKTISFENFFNNSPLGPSNMSVLFTEKIKDYFERNTSLEIVEEACRERKDKPRNSSQNLSSFELESQMVSWSKSER